MDFLVNLDVDDLERGVDFYGSLFGLQVGRRLGGYAVELLGGPAPIYLLQKNADSAATPDGSQQRHYGRHWTPVHLDFVVDDIESATAKAIARVRGWNSRSRPKAGAAWRCWPTLSATASA